MILNGACGSLFGVRPSDSVHEPCGVLPADRERIGSRGCLGVRFSDEDEGDRRQGE